LHLKIPAAEQHANMAFCVLLYTSLPGTLRILREACGKAATKKRQVYERHKLFGDNRASVDDDPRCWQPSTSTNDENLAMCAMLCDTTDEGVFRIYQR
jgi:hypothetical protein